MPATTKRRDSSRTRNQRTDNTGQLIADIHERLNNLEELLMWSTFADDRFVIGQRVEFSPLADRRCISKGRKHGVRQGVIESFESRFAIRVKLDGYKRAHGFWHGFFQVAKRKAKP